MHEEDEDALYSIVGESIRRLRRQKNITQQELAEQLGMLRTSVTNIEAGRQRAPLHTLSAIASCLGVSLATLLSEASVCSDHECMQVRRDNVRLRKTLTTLRSILLHDDDV